MEEDIKENGLVEDGLDDDLEDGLEDDSLADLSEMDDNAVGFGDPGEVGGGEEEVRNLDLILDIPLAVTVELGRTKMLINDLLQLSQGSVIELTKLVGEPLEVLVNQKLVARGEVVVVNEKFGIRLTDIVSPLERVQSLS